MSRNANSEQLKAIQHHGGVLLSAGAGSGKTFVLVEHLIYLIEAFAEKHKSLLEQDGQGFQSHLRQYLSQIVVMTFTKKAAGELSLRIKKKIESQDQSKLLWRLAKEVIGVMTVGTIHSFCHRVLTSGDIPNFDPNLEISSEIDQHYKVKIAFEAWYEQLSAEQKNNWVTQTFLSNRRSLEQSLVQIFSSPELRLMWKKQDSSAPQFFDLKSQLLDCYRLLEIDQLFASPVLVPETKSKGKWPAYIESYNQLLLSHPPYSVENLKKYVTFFADHKGIKAPSKCDELMPIINAMDKLKDFRQFLQNYFESLEASALHQKTNLQVWRETFLQIVRYIEAHYLDTPGFNFSDLEYYFISALDQAQVVSRIATKYKYFIVDEFQDTSYIQYEILTKLIQNDFSRLFCVGDKKQAIYGFRGGELGVFEQCSQSIPHRLQMTNNYRSKEVIINFNNELFKNLFAKGMGFTGHDPFQVEVLAQTYPHSSSADTAAGRIHRGVLQITDESWSRLTTSEIAVMEASFFADFLQEYLQKNSDKKVAVLYSKLTSSRYLISLLIARHMGFTAQIKVPLASDPLLCLFKLLLQVYLTARDAPQMDYRLSADLLMRGLFHYLKLDYPSQMLTHLEQWLSDLPLIGLKNSTYKMLYTLGLHCSNYSNNYKMIDDLCRVSRGNIDLCYQWLDQQSDGTYSIDFQTGENGSQIQLMTVHASKGLEFDCVLLAGISTNGGRRADVSFFGKNPGSFRWKLTADQRDAYQTPEYILESLISKRKDFAESKRLFYVACTRAIDTLVWCDIQYTKGGYSYGENSWIDGLRGWADDAQGTPLSLFVAKGSHQVEVHRHQIEEDILKLPVKSPLFHLDNLGVVKRPDPQVLGITCELSVTRLSLLAKCPFKFYLKNICKIDESALDENDLSERADRYKEQSEDFLTAFDDEMMVRRNSEQRMARGTEIHKAIEISLTEKQTNSSSESLILRNKYQSILHFVEQQLAVYREQYGEPQLICEQPLKFSFFGQTINGIPDLVIKGKQLQIWDFKTGRRMEEHEDAYWFQLRAYAYALAKQMNYADDQQISLVLLYVDQSCPVKREESFEQIRTSLFKVWERSSALHLKSEHCQGCGYLSVCRP